MFYNNYLGVLMQNHRQRRMDPEIPSLVYPIGHQNPYAARFSYIPQAISIV